VEWLFFGLMGLFYLAGLPVALVMIFTLRTRVRRLEEELEKSTGQPLTSKTRTAAFSRASTRADAYSRDPAARAAARGEAAEPSPEAPAGVSASEPGHESARESARASARAAAGGATRDSASWEALVGGRWLTWIGVLAIFFGTAFFVALDLEGSPLSGVFQVLVGLAVALVFVVAGRWLAGRAERFLGLGLLGGGIALLYLVAFGAHGFHQLVPAVAVYPFLVAVAVIGAVLALRQQSAVIAALTLIGALLTPLILAVPSDPSAALFPYLLAVNVGTVIVGRRAGWAGLPLAAFAGSAILLTSWADRHYSLEVRPAVALVTAGLWGLYAVVPLLPPHRPGFWSTARGLLVVVNGLIFSLVMWALLAPDHEHLRGLALAILALVYVGGERVARRGVPASLGRELTQVTGIAIAALAVPVQFDRSWITLGWTVLAGALFWADLRGAGRSYRPLALLVVVLALVTSVVWEPFAIASRDRAADPLTNGAFLTGLGVVALLIGVAVAYRRRAGAVGKDGAGSATAAGERSLSTVALITALLLLLWKITFEIWLFYAVREAGLQVDPERATLLTISLVWAIYALAVIAAGFWLRMRSLRTLGIAIAGLLIAKVFVLDLQVLERGYRIVSFVGVGVLLLIVSVLFQRRRTP